MSRFIRHDPCPNCGSSDGLGIYEDNEHCFVCSYHKNYGDNDISNNHEIRHAVNMSVTPLPAGEQGAIKDRSILASSVNKYRVTVNTNSESQVGHVYPYFDEDGSHVANKIRRKGEKAFYWEWDTQSGVLFGQSFFPPGGRAVTIVEGECDALATFQLTGSRYPCVSVKSSVEAKKNCADNFEYLNSFDKIVLCLDNDEPGQKAALAIAQLFQPGKVHIIKLEKAKDPNDYLMAGLEKEFINEWHRAPAYTPDGLLLGNDPSLLTDIIDYNEPQSIPSPWSGLNHAIYGFRLSEFTLFLADTGVGKTTFMKEIEYKLLMDEEVKKYGYGIGFLHLEEPKRDTALGLMSIHRNKTYHLPDTVRSRDELIEAYNEVINTPRVVIYDHFGANDIDVIVSKVRHMAAMGCRYIVLDHLSIIVSDHSQDERKGLDEISTKLKTLCMNLDICLICVVHVNRNGEVRGSAGPEKVANNMVRLIRDKKDPDEWRRNVTQIMVEKCRLSGRSGPAGYVWYDPDTGRLVELSKELSEAYERGDSVAGKEFEAYGS
jgi:twinkle protein